MNDDTERVYRALQNWLRRKSRVAVGFLVSDAPFAEPDKLPVFCIEGFQEARKGKVLSLNKKSFECPGALLYAGYAKPSPGLPGFISGINKAKNWLPSMSDSTIIAGLRRNG